LIVQRLKALKSDRRSAGGLCTDRPFSRSECFDFIPGLRLEHGDVDVFKDATRGDADYAVGRFDQIITLATAMLTTQMIDETES